MEPVTVIYAVCMVDPGFLCLLEGAGGHREKAGGLCACPGAEVKWRACSFSSRHTGKYDIREKARQRSAPPGFFCFVSFHIFCVCFGKSCAALSHPEDKKTDGLLSRQTQKTNGYLFKLRTGFDRAETDGGKEKTSSAPSEFAFCFR